VNSIRIEAGGQSYEVLVGKQLLADAGRLIARKLKGPGCAVITDENVGRHFAEIVTESVSSAGFRPTVITVPAGEESKTMAQAEAICSQLGTAGLDRGSFVVALGGGMIGDLAGFVAAIYHRGIPCVQVPTTLLAQVDSSIGGKTAVNTAAAKNVIGAWHQPALVISDVETLETLPAREFRQGFAEIVKHAVIRDAALFETIERFEATEIEALVRRNIEIKGEIVAADVRETKGQRALLNFGHTIGHAIEHAGGYWQFLHGEAISLGIVGACEISVRKAGLPTSERDRIVSALGRLGLPVRLPEGFAKKEILDVTRSDKKFVNGAVRFVVAPRIGEARLVDNVTYEDIAAALQGL
jgi:3-dehydroquinate synthase